MQQLQVAATSAVPTVASSRPRDRSWISGCSSTLDRLLSCLISVRSRCGARTSLAMALDHERAPGRVVCDHLGLSNGFTRSPRTCTLSVIFCSLHQHCYDTTPCACRSYSRQEPIDSDAVCRHIHANLHQEIHTHRRTSILLAPLAQRHPHQLQTITDTITITIAHSELMDDAQSLQPLSVSIARVAASRCATTSALERHTSP